MGDVCEGPGCEAVPPAAVRGRRPRRYCSFQCMQRRNEADARARRLAARAARGGSTSWMGDAVGYAGAHLRAQRRRGAARLHPCAHCGGRAAEWAYDHADPGEVARADYRGQVMTYSPDPAHYVPLCKVCHKRFDQR